MKYNVKLLKEKEELLSAYNLIYNVYRKMSRKPQCFSMWMNWHHFKIYLEKYDIIIIWKQSKSKSTQKISNYTH